MVELWLTYSYAYELRYGESLREAVGEYFRPTYHLGGDGYEYCGDMLVVKHRHSGDPTVQWGTRRTVENFGDPARFLRETIADQMEQRRRQEAETLAVRPSVGDLTRFL